jgi:hypothetical protein
MTQLRMKPNKFDMVITLEPNEKVLFVQLTSIPHGCWFTRTTPANFYVHYKQLNERGGLLITIIQVWCSPYRILTATVK